MINSILVFPILHWSCFCFLRFLQKSCETSQIPITSETVRSDEQKSISLTEKNQYYNLWLSRDNFPLQERKGKVKWMTIHVVLNHRKSNTTEFFITCSYAFDELVHNSDFFWLLIDVFRQLLEHFALVGMNTKLLTPKTRKHKSIINENRRAIKWTDDDVEVQFISVCIHNQYSYLPFGERCSHG